MKEITALQLRQSLSAVTRLLEHNGEPVLLKRGRQPVAVLISLRDYHERFAERAAHEARRAILAELDELARPAVDGTPAAELLRGARYG